MRRQPRGPAIRSVYGYLLHSVDETRCGDCYSIIDLTRANSQLCRMSFFFPATFMAVGKKEPESHASKARSISPGFSLPPDDSSRIWWTA